MLAFTFTYCFSGRWYILDSDVSFKHTLVSHIPNNFQMGSENKTILQKQTVNKRTLIHLIFFQSSCWFPVELYQVCKDIIIYTEKSKTLEQQQHWHIDYDVDLPLPREWFQVYNTNFSSRQASHITNAFHNAPLYIQLLVGTARNLTR